MKRVLFTILFTTAIAASASAQPGALVSSKVQFFQNGAILPTQVMTITLPSGVACGQPKAAVPVGGVFITTSGRISWEDPSNSAFDCVAIQTAGGVLLSLPLGANYTATVTFTDDFGGVSPVSAASNSFTRGARPLPPAATGVKVLQ